MSSLDLEWINRRRKVLRKKELKLRKRKASISKTPTLGSFDSPQRKRGELTPKQIVEQKLFGRAVTADRRVALTPPFPVSFVAPNFGDEEWEEEGRQKEKRGSGRKAPLEAMRFRNHERAFSRRTVVNQAATVVHGADSLDREHMRVENFNHQERQRRILGRPISSLDPKHVVTANFHMQNTKFYKRVPTAPPIITMLKPKSFTVRWNDPFRKVRNADAAVVSQFQCSDNSRDFSRPLELFLQGSKRKMTHVTVDDLQPSTPYFCRVRLFNGKQWSSWSLPLLRIETKRVRTPDAPTLPKVVTPDHAVEIRVVWTAPKDDGGTSILQYEVRAQSIDRNGSWQEAFAKTDGPVTWADIELSGDPIGVERPAAKKVQLCLRREVSYVVSVRARNSMGWGEWSQETSLVSGVLNPIEPPRRIRVVDRKYNSATIAWDEPVNTGGAFVEAYEVAVSKDFGLTWPKEMRHDAGINTKILVPGLEAGTKYWIKIKARNALGWGKQSEMITFRTREPFPISGKMIIE
eukprot:g568.t1